MQHSFVLWYSTCSRYLFIYSHACWLKTSISFIEDNFSRLTHKSGRVVFNTWLITKIQLNSPPPQKKGAPCWLCVLTLSQHARIFVFQFAFGFEGLETISWQVVGTSSDIFGKVRTSSEIFVSSYYVFGNPGYVVFCGYGLVSSRTSLTSGHKSIKECCRVETLISKTKCDPPQENG